MNGVYTVFILTVWELLCFLCCLRMVVLHYCLVQPHNWKTWLDQRWVSECWFLLKTSLLLIWLDFTNSGLWLYRPALQLDRRSWYKLFTQSVFHWIICSICSILFSAFCMHVRSFFPIGKRLSFFSACLNCVGKQSLESVISCMYLRIFLKSLFRWTELFLTDTSSLSKCNQCIWRFSPLFSQCVSFDHWPPAGFRSQRTQWVMSALFWDSFF